VSLREPLLARGKDLRCRPSSAGRRSRCPATTPTSCPRRTADSGSCGEDAVLGRGQVSFRVGLRPHPHTRVGEGLGELLKRHQRSRSAGASGVPKFQQCSRR
jgi:hypothetical protein